MAFSVPLQPTPTDKFQSKQKTKKKQKKNNKNKTKYFKPNIFSFFLKKKIIIQKKNK